MHSGMQSAAIIELFHSYIYKNYKLFFRKHSVFWNLEYSKERINNHSRFIANPRQTCSISLHSLYAYYGIDLHRSNELSLCHDNWLLFEMKKQKIWENAIHN